MNYPDDIRSYRYNPSSPFYLEWRCPICGLTEDETDCDKSWCTTTQQTNDTEDYYDDY